MVVSAVSLRCRVKIAFSNRDPFWNRCKTTFLLLEFQPNTIRSNNHTSRNHSAIIVGDED